MSTSTKTKVTAIECPTCHNLIYSRARHDFRRCSCGEVAVDGGFDYMKISFKDVLPERRIKYVCASRQELFNDWNLSKDKFGKIDKPKKKK